MGLQAIGGLKIEYSKSLIKPSTSKRTGCEISEGTEKALSIMRFNRQFSDTFTIKGNI